jgi:ribose transport system ATP-binding protein
MTDAPPLLEMEGIAKSFGPTRALREVSFAVRPGEVMALIGENGAGKSTLMKILSGAHPADRGRMRIAGRPYAPRGPHDARRAGVAMIYQELNLAPHLSVVDNVMLGQERHRLGLLNRRAQEPLVRQALNLLGHPELRPNTPVRNLSVGARQLVEIARALVMDSRIIVFDEPTSSLTQRDAEHLFSVIDRLKRSGLGVVYISHFLEEIRRVCDRFTVLRDGQVVGQGDAAATDEGRIVALMVGRAVDDMFPLVPHEAGEPILHIESLTGRRAPSDVSLALRRGEILGIFGLVGAGRTELARAVFGLDAVRGGRVRVGQFTPAPQPAARIRAGMGFVSEDRKGEGLAQQRSLVDNLTYSRLAPYSTWGVLNLARRAGAARRWIERLAIRARSPEQPARQLSGGNQQKIALARVLHQDADVLLLDEPTRGIDVGTKVEIYRLMGELAAGGKAILFISSYLPELLAVCDRLGVMVRGRLREIRPRGGWSEEEVMACAISFQENMAAGGRT